jgi:hypothetical protein
LPRRISRVLGVESSELRSRGVFNGFVDIDSKFYVDPYLLRSAKTPELLGGYDDYRRHFVAVLKLLRASKEPDDAMAREVARRLTFPEAPIVALGYARGDTEGSGIGPELAARLAKTAKQIVDAGIDDPTVFDLVGLIEENIGADRISDMTTQLVMPRLLDFTARIARELKVRTGVMSYEDQRYSVPFDPKTGKAVLLMPRELLRTLPVARDWSDIDFVAAENMELRGKVNQIIGDTWKHATREVKKRDLRDVLLANPALIRDLITQYARKPAHAYDFDKDPEGQIVWADFAREFAERFPLSLEATSRDTVLQVVRLLCERFGRLVENNGLNRLFYADGGKLRHERFAQLLFFGVADAYCEANNLDLSREPNAGRGPVDFKVSGGYTSRVSVEVKYSKNTDLVHGFEKQLPVYEAAERSFHSIYLILRTTESERGIQRVLALRDGALAQNKRAPEVMVFDVRVEPSASKA